MCQWCGVDDPNSNAGVGIILAVMLVIGLIYSIYNWIVNNLYLVVGSVLVIVALGVLIAAIQLRSENGGQGGLLAVVVAVVLGLTGAGAAINGYENYTEFSFEMPSMDGSSSDDADASTDNASADTYDEVYTELPVVESEQEPEPVEQPMQIAELPAPQLPEASRSPSQRQFTIPPSTEAAPPAPTPPSSQAREATTKNERSWAARIQEVYPASAWREGRQGTVGLRVNVTTDGRAADCQVVVSSGSPDLDQAACMGMERYARFNPALDSEGRPITSAFSTRITYQIN